MVEQLIGAFGRRLAVVASHSEAHPVGDQVWLQLFHLFEHRIGHFDGVGTGGFSNGEGDGVLEIGCFPGLFPTGTRAEKNVF